MWAILLTSLFVLPLLTSKYLILSSPFNNSTLQSSCSNPTQCIGDQVCQDSYCFCAPNFRDANDSGKCLPFRCQSAMDCQSSDLNRVCESGQCACDMNVYLPDHDNGGKCSLKRCDHQTSCSYTNTVCQDGRCRCAENFRYNYTLRDCGQFSCQSTLDCNYEGSVCVSGCCVCGPGYKPDLNDGKLCKPVSKSYGKPCDDGLDNWKGAKCDWKEREICVDHQCLCEIDYRNDSGHCEPSVCRQSSDCQSYDEHRVCDRGQCVCDRFYVQNATDGYKCQLKTHGMHCSSVNNCTINERCVDKQCICDVDHRLVDGIELCQAFNCTQTDFCGDDFDQNRVCDKRSGHCVCKESYSEDANNGNKCGPDANPANHLFLLIFVPTLSATIIVITLIWILVSKCRHHFRNGTDRLQSGTISMRAMVANDNNVSAQ